MQAADEGPAGLARQTWARWVVELSVLTGTRNRVIGYPFWEYQQPFQPCQYRTTALPVPFTKCSVVPRWLQAQSSLLS